MIQTQRTMHTGSQQILTLAFRRSNDVVYTKLCCKSWKCVYVSGLLQFCEYCSSICPVITTSVRENLEKFRSQREKLVYKSIFLFLMIKIGSIL